MKLLAVMIDCAEPKIIRELDLPNLKKHGVNTYKCGIANTGPQMASFLFGLSPAEHRIREYKPGINRLSVKGQIIWEKIKASIGIMNIPLCYPPPEKMNGWLVCGIDTPLGKPYTYPPKLWLELDALEYIIHPEKNRDRGCYAMLPLEPRPPEYDWHWFKRVWTRTVKKRVECFLHLCKKYPVEIGILGITVLDSVCHCAYPIKPDIVSYFYKLVDELVGNLIEELSPDDYILFSDHGCVAGSCTGRWSYGVHGSPAYYSTTLDRKIEKIEDIHNLVVEIGNSNEDKIIKIAEGDLRKTDEQIKKLKSIGYL